MAQQNGDIVTAIFLKISLDILYSFGLIPQLYTSFTWKVSSMAIGDAVYFHGAMKFCDHQHNCELSYPDHP